MTRTAIEVSGIQNESDFFLKSDAFKRHCQRTKKMW